MSHPSHRSGEHLSHASLLSIRPWKRQLQDKVGGGPSGMAVTALKGLSVGHIISSRDSRPQLQLRFNRQGDVEEHVDLRPPLKWAGGKRWLLPYLEGLWEPFSERRLVEPFVGGLGVTLGLMPKRALLNDINPHPVNLYRWMQKGLKIERPMINSTSAYRSNRNRFNELVHQGKGRTKEAAELFYYLNRTCFNGLCRFNRAGEFNVPKGSYKVVEYRTDFSAYVPVMRNWEFSVGDFEGLRLLPTDFVYADPPYDVEFTSYSKQPFGWNEQVRLAKWLAKHKGPVVLSNQATDRVLTLYERLGFERTIITDAPRLISCNGDRTPAREVLATRNLPE